MVPEMSMMPGFQKKPVPCEPRNLKSQSNVESILFSKLDRIHRVSSNQKIGANFSKSTTKRLVYNTQKITLKIL
jgi:hypothetical protein